MKLKLIKVDDLPPICSCTELIEDQSLAFPPEIIKGVLHQGGKAVLASASKARKTWVLLDLALSVANGLPWLDWETTPGKVLLVNFEIPAVFLRERIKALATVKEQCCLDNLHVWNLRGNASAFSDLLPPLGDAIRELGYSLVIIDPIYKGLAGANENSAGDIASLCNQLERLCTQSGAAILYAHHFSKGNKANQAVLDRMSGSGVFARDADTIFTLTSHQEADCYTLDLTLRNFPAVAPVVVRWEFPVMQVRDDLRSEDLKQKKVSQRDKRRQQVFARLIEGPMTTKEWELAAEKMGISRAAFHRYLQVFKLTGVVTLDVDSRKWRVTKPEVLSPDNPQAHETRDSDEPTKLQHEAIDFTI